MDDEDYEEKDIKEFRLVKNMKNPRNQIMKS